MTEQWLRDLLAQVAAGDIGPSEALTRLATFPTEDLGFANVDHVRALTQGYPEVVFCLGKSVAQVLGICEALQRRTGGFLATRADKDMRAALNSRFEGVEVNAVARTAYLELEAPPSHLPGRVLIASAGTSDVPVAEEAAVVARALGNAVETLHDVGVAGIHRVLQNSEKLHDATVIIVVAGMDGALASVIGGLVGVPVIAVPTSVGYGMALGGISALLAMLNSCASGVTVVNIDNGFGAAFAATRIARSGLSSHGHEPK